MARRILSADAALVPQAQPSLHGPFRADPGAGAGPGVLAALQARWLERPAGLGPEALFDWEDRTALMEEIAFVNRAQGLLDEAAVKIAPSVLKIVLTVKEHVPDGAGQRAFLADHLTLDFRRISELCIVADSYRLLEPARRPDGEQEIVRYGWSKALKLAHVRDAHERRDIWRRACAGAEQAGYRAVLEEIRRYRERKQILPPGASGAAELGAAFRSAREAFLGLERRLIDGHAGSRAECTGALREVGRLRRELDALQRALRDRLETLPLEALTEELAAEA